MTTLLSPYLLASQGDRMAMSHGVETRVPFLDHRLFEFAASLPERSKLRGLREKDIVRRWAKNVLPGAAPKNVVAFVTDQDVVPFAADENVITLATLERVEPRTAIQVVVSRETGRIRLAGHPLAVAVSPPPPRLRDGGGGMSNTRVGIISCRRGVLLVISW